MCSGECADIASARGICVSPTRTQRSEGPRHTPRPFACKSAVAPSDGTAVRHQVAIRSLEETPLAARGNRSGGNARRRRVSGGDRGRARARSVRDRAGCARLLPRLSRVRKHGIDTCFTPTRGDSAGTSSEPSAAATPSDPAPTTTTTSTRELDRAFRARRRQTAPVTQTTPATTTTSTRARNRPKRSRPPVATTDSAAAANAVKLEAPAPATTTAPATPAATGAPAAQAAAAPAATPPSGAPPARRSCSWPGQLRPLPRRQPQQPRRRAQQPRTRTQSSRSPPSASTPLRGGARV